MTSPFDDILALLHSAPALDGDGAHEAAAVAREAGAPAVLADLAGWLVAVRGNAPIRRPLVALYVSAYAASGEGASARAAAALERASDDSAALTALAREAGAGVEVFDLASAQPLSPKRSQMMSEREAAATMAFGFEALAKSPDLLILAALTEGSGEAVRRVEAALADTPPLEALCREGGRELAALVGAIAAAGQERVPVILDGAAALMAARLVEALRPGGAGHCRDASAILPQTGVNLAEPGTTGVAVAALVRLASALR